MAGSIVRMAALLGGVLASGCAFSAGSKAGEAQRGAFAARSPIPLEGQEDVRGEVEDVEGGKVVIRTRQGPIELHADDETTVFSEGQVGSLSDLKQGEGVRASVAQDRGRNVALWIETARPAPERPAAGGELGPAAAGEER